MNDNKYYYGFIRNDATRRIVSCVRKDELQIIDDNTIYLDILNKIHFIKVA